VREGERILLYHPYTLARGWEPSADANVTRRILVIEPSLMTARPLAPHRMRLIMQLAAEIEGLEAHVGEVSDIVGLARAQSVHARAHPYTRDWPAQFEPPLRVVPQAETRNLDSFSAWFRHARRHLERDGLMVRPAAKQRPRV
jgi:hypothetical protein